MTAILCRATPENAPIVFLADTLQDGKIKAWQDGRARSVPVAYYQQTRPVSDADAEHMRKAYASATKQSLEEVHIRQRLPRVFRELPSLFATGGSPSPAPAPAPANGGTKRSRAEAARAQYEADKRATEAAAQQAGQAAGAVAQQAAASVSQATGGKLTEEQLRALSERIARVIAERL